MLKTARAVPLSARTLDTCARRMSVPEYDRAAVSASVVHIGVGSFHRAHQAMYLDRLLHQDGRRDWGICGVGVLPSDRRMRDVLQAQDGLYTLVTKHRDGDSEARVVGSIVEYLFAPDDPRTVVEKMSDPATRLVSLTITEGGYNVSDVDGTFVASNREVVADVPRGARSRTVFGLVVEALRRRRERGVAPFPVLSCDNVEGNGERARTAFASFAALRDADLAEWILQEVPFPSSVVDRITPATTDADRGEVRERLGVEDGWPVVCEPYSQWVVEDAAPAICEALAAAGAQLVGDVRPHEQMKLRLLNAGHQAVAYFGRLCGHEHVDEAMRDPAVRAFLVAFLDEEAVPTISSVAQADLSAYRGAVIERFSSAAVRDPLARLRVDASDRIPKFVLPLVRERLARDLDVRRSAALVASWARCAAGFDEDGEVIDVADRRGEALMTRARNRGDGRAFLADDALFGGLADDARFARAFEEALSSLYARGARATLAAYA